MECTVCLDVATHSMQMFQSGASLQDIRAAIEKEWASHSIGFSDWAKTYYQQQRAKGKSHHIAVRSLAFKWIRILFRCWRDRQPYREELYRHALMRRSSPAHTNQTVQVQWKTTAGFCKFAGFSLD